MHNFQFGVECMDGEYIHGPEGVGGFRIKFMVLLDKQPKYFGAGLKTVYTPVLHTIAGEVKGTWMPLNQQK